MIDGSNMRAGANRGDGLRRQSDALGAKATVSASKVTFSASKVTDPAMKATETAFFLLDPVNVSTWPANRVLR